MALIHTIVTLGSEHPVKSILPLESTAGEGGRCARRLRRFHLWKKRRSREGVRLTKMRASYINPNRGKNPPISASTHYLVSKPKAVEVGIFRPPELSTFRSPGTIPVIGCFCYLTCCFSFFIKANEENDQYDRYQDIFTG
jgi:hypothetical protein